MRVFVCTVLLSAAAITADAQAVISAVTDAASFAPRVSPGSLATIFGSGLASSTSQAEGLPLPPTLGGASVVINQTKAPLLYASSSQINFQVPSSLTPGLNTLFVSVGGGNSLPFTFNVVSSAPAIFQDTSNHAVAQNASANYTVNTTKNPAASGSVVVVYLTGQGNVDNPVSDGTAAPSSPIATATSTPTATIGGVNAPVQFLGLTPGFVGLAQANIQVPTLPSGDYPLVIKVGNFLSASAVISVSGSGTTPPQFLTLVGQVVFANDPISSVAVAGNTTYVCGANRIVVVDTSSVTNPIFVGQFGSSDLNGNGGKCYFTKIGTTPILVDLMGPGSAAAFVVYNLSSPQQPALLGTITAQRTFLSDLTFVGNTGFSSTSSFSFDGANNITAQEGDFLAYDFSALLPQLVSVMPPNQNAPASNNLNVRPNALALPSRFGLVYVASTTATGNSTAGNGALDVIDVSNISLLQGVTRITASNTAIFLGLSYDNLLLLLTGNTTGFRNPGNPDFNLTGNLTLTTMNINNVRIPVFTSTLVTDIATSGTFEVQPFGSSIFAIVNRPPATDLGGPGSLMLVDARNTKTPLLYPFLTQFGLSGIASVNGFLLAPTVNGLSIYKFQLQ